MVKLEKELLICVLLSAPLERALGRRAQNECGVGRQAWAYLVSVYLVPNLELSQV